MKKLLIVLAIVALSGMWLLGCASGKNLKDFSDAIGTELRLLEVHIDGTFGREIIFDRRTLTREGDGKIFTIKFDGQIVSGTGAPNLYSAPYTLGDDQSISIMPMRSTLMASLFEPEKLPEHQFFGYMQNANKWQFVDGNLELLSRTEDGREVRLVFGR